MHVRDHIEMYLCPKDAEKFARWAFGEHFKNIDLNYMGHIYWNELHGEELHLRGDGNPIEDIPKMIELWKKYNLRHAKIFDELDLIYLKEPLAKSPVSKEYFGIK